MTGAATGAPAHLVRPGGVRIGYQLWDPPAGTGALVVLVMGTGSPGRVWQLYQVPALRAAGYRVATLDNRGIGASDAGPSGFTVHDMADDVAALVEHVGGPARAVGTSLGARVVLELARARPDLVDRVVAMGAHARIDAVRRSMNRAEIALIDQGVELPADYRAAVAAVQNLSPATVRDERTARDWLDVLAYADAAPAGRRAQLELSATQTDRTEAYRGIRAPVLALAFADDRVIPPYLTREVADAVPTARYHEVPETGHYGYLERPDVVNGVLLDFLAG